MPIKRLMRKSNSVLRLPRRTLICRLSSLSSRSMRPLLRVWRSTSPRVSLVGLRRKPKGPAFIRSSFASPITAHRRSPPSNRSSLPFATSINPRFSIQLPIAPSIKVGHWEFQLLPAISISRQMDSLFRWTREHLSVLRSIPPQVFFLGPPQQLSQQVFTQSPSE